MLRARIADSDVKAAILDLDAPENSLAIIRELRGEEGRPGLDPDRKIAILAFGPHAPAAPLEQPGAAGAAQVRARGAFARNLPAILKQLNAGPV